MLFVIKSFFITEFVAQTQWIRKTNKEKISESVETDPYFMIIIHYLNV